MPRVSIVIPVYNAEAFLRECVATILCQTMRDFEVILVDDGSKDTSPALCDELARQDARVRVIHQANQGSGIARNTGMDAALGDYIYFSDADDYLEPDLLEKNLQPGETADIVIFGYYQQNADGSDTPRPFVCSLPGRWTNEELIREHFYEYFSTRARTLWARLFRTAFLRENGFRFNTFSIGQDRDFILQTDLHLDHTVVIYDRPYYHYVRRDGTSIRRYRKEGYARYGIHLAEMFEQVSRINPALDSKSIGLINRYYVEAVLNELKNAAHPQADLTWAERKAQITKLLRQPRVKEAVDKVPLHDIAGRWSRVTIVLMRMGLIRAAFLLKRFW